jgi:hypothetical protein
LCPVQCVGSVFEGPGAVAICAAKLPEFSQKGNSQGRIAAARMEQKSLLPSFRGQGIVQLVRMMPTVVLELARIFMSLAVSPSFAHKVPFMELMEEHIGPLNFLQVIVNPHLVVWNELIDMVVSPLRKIDIEHAPHEPPVNDPHAHP